MPQPDAIHRESSSHSSDLSLTSYTPVDEATRNSPNGESSTSGRTSRSIGTAEERSSLVDGQVHGSPGTSGKIGRTNGTVVKRSKPRSSGGFLLDSAIQQSRQSRAPSSQSQNAQKDGKSKRANNEQDLSVPKRRSAGRQDIQRSSIGSSPLATEVTRDQDVDEDRGKNAGQNSFYDGAVATPPKTPRSSVGFDTDPAQIVNMALSLSEGRRRQAAGMRIGSVDTGGRRATHIGQGLTGRVARAGSGAGQHHNPPRHLSLTASPLSGKYRRMEATPSSALDESIVTHRSNPTEPNDTSGVAEFAETFYDISESTFARVQKAKNHFELLYEHRRLLSHLPPLRTPEDENSRKATSRSSVTPGGRDYNPLQYVRNRKLRFREKSPINSEAEGWYDVQQVRAWVDAIIALHNQGPRCDPDECVRLPELNSLKVQEEDESTDDEKDSMVISSPASSIRRRSEPAAVKPRRPRSDWVTSPGDLLADAFWLEQGLNKTKLEDNDGNKLYPPFTQFSFSGWRDRKSTHIPPEQIPTPPPEMDPEMEDSSVKQNLTVPELPKFRANSKDGKPASRGRRRGRIRGSDTGSPNSDSGSQGHRKKLRKKVLRSRSRSSTSEDRGDKVNSSGRKKPATRDVNGLGLDNAALPNQHSTTSLDHDLDRPTPSSTELSKNLDVPSSASAVVGDESQRPDLRGRTKSKSSSRPGSHRRGESIRSIFEWPKSRKSLEGERPNRTSAEYDTTAPNSPATTVDLPSAGFPSIAINLSPPPSRSPSPTKKPTRINPFRDRSQRRQYSGISATDFADVNNSPGSRNSTGDGDSARPISIPGSRGTSPMTKKNSVDDARFITEAKRTSSTISKGSEKMTTPPVEPPSRVRGIFKGGRIAELVGNEVSRVGDFIWKRELPGSRLRASTSTASVVSQNASDTDDDDEISRTENSLTRVQTGTHVRGFPSVDSTTSSTNLSPSQSRTASGSAESAQYHNTNLPTFSSPFQRDRELQNERDRTFLGSSSSVSQAQNGDHISRLAVNHRAGSRSPRLDRLAPPKLDISRASSLTPSITNERRNTYGFPRDFSLAGPANASQIFNTTADDEGPMGPPITGLAGLKASQSDSRLSRGWNASSQNLPAEVLDPPATRREIARTSALLLSSGAKAREITRHSMLIREPIPKFLRDTIESTNGMADQSNPLRVARKDEHVLAARNLMSKLSTQSGMLRTNMNAFSSQTSPTLHTELQALDDMLENTLTPRVRTTGDEAGELTMRLTTTSSLAVKGLNDVIDGAMRRRRRGPVRWLRRFGYVIIEWTVVGLMWAIWLVVVVVRIFTSSIRGSYNAARWLMWM